LISRLNLAGAAQKENVALSSDAPATSREVHGTDSDFITIENVQELSIDAVEVAGEGFAPSGRDLSESVPHYAPATGGLSQTGVKIFLKSFFFLLALAMLAPLSASAAVNLATPNLNALSSGLVGYWPLDGNTTNWNTDTTADVSGNGNTGTLVNMSTTSSPVAGKIGQALEFNGSNQYVTIPSLSGLGTTNTATFSAWVYSNANQNSYEAISFGRYGGYAGLQTSGYATNMLTFAWTGASSEYFANTGLVIPNKKWTFVGVVITPTNATLYMNGSTYVQTQTNSPQAFTAWTIGRDPEGESTRLWNGAIDDVRIYNRALSAQEVQQLYQMGR
jgi:hypothetical protein